MNNKLDITDRSYSRSVRVKLHAIVFLTYSNTLRIIIVYYAMRQPHHKQ